MTTSTTHTGARALDAQATASHATDPVQARPMTYAEHVAQVDDEMDQLDPIGWGHPLVLSAIVALVATVTLVVLLVRIALRF